MSKLHCTPATSQVWPDVEKLFGERGICGGCWCMWWLKTSKEYEADKGETNKRDFRTLINSGRCPGLLFYVDDTPIAWCALAERERYGRLNSSRILKPVDDSTVWSIVCIHVRKDYRRQGLSTQIVGLARDFAISSGAGIVEAYPLDPRKPEVPDIFSQTGFKSSFEKNQFVEVARRSEGRPIMRYSPKKK